MRTGTRPACGHARPHDRRPTPRNHHARPHDPHVVRPGTIPRRPGGDEQGRHGSHPHTRHRRASPLQARTGARHEGTRTTVPPPVHAMAPHARRHMPDHARHVRTMHDHRRPHPPQRTTPVRTARRPATRPDHHRPQQRPRIPGDRGTRRRAPHGPRPHRRRQHRTPGSHHPDGIHDIRLASIMVETRWDTAADPRARHDIADAIARALEGRA